MSRRPAHRRPGRWPTSDAGGVPGGAGLALRAVRADPWVSALLAVLVLVVTLAGTLWPRLVADLGSRQAAYALGGLSVAQRDVVGTTVVTGSPAVGTAGVIGVFDPPEVTWEGMRDGLAALRAAQPEPLGSVLEPGRFVVEVRGRTPIPGDPASEVRFADLIFRVDPMIMDLVRIVEGEPPMAEVPVATSGTNPEGEPLPTSDAEALEIMLSQDAAGQLAWEVGEVREVLTVGPVRLSGIYQALDPDDPHWQQTPFGAELGTFFDLNIGLTAVAGAYLAPGNPGTLLQSPSREFRVWFPLAADAVPGDQVLELDAQLAAFTATQQPVVASRGPSAPAGEQPGDVPPPAGDTPTEDTPPCDTPPCDTPPPPGHPDGAAPYPAVQELTVRFSSEVSDVLRDLAAGRRATASILAVVAAGPLGVTLAVFALGARLVVQRRRTPLALARARGGSDRQLRGLLAVEGLVLGVPAALLGYAVAGLVLPGTTGWGEWVLAGAFALVPAVALATGPALASLREERRDLGSVHHRRWIAEAAVVALAGLALWQLLDRGLVGVEAAGADSPGAGAAGAAAPGVEPARAGVDLLMTGTPVLLALTACVLTLRVHPLLMRAVAGRLRRRPSLTPFLGAARAVRDPAGGLVPALAVVLAVGVATFSTVLVSTVDDGAERAAWAANGADIRVAGPLLTADVLETVRATPGVGTVAVVGEGARTVEVTGDLALQGATVYVVDDDLVQVHAAAPLVEAFPAELYADGPGIQILTGGAERPDTEGDGAEAPEVQLGGVGPATVVGHVGDIPGVLTTSSFVVITASDWEQAGQATATGTTALISLAPESPGPSSTAEALREAVPNSQVDTPQAQLEQVRAAPVSSGLTAILLAAAAATLGLTVLAVLLVQLMGAPTRARLLAVLRTLGSVPRQARALSAWELGPVVATAIVVGAVLGLAVPWLLLQSVDLRGLTGGVDQPALAVDPVALGVLALTVLATVTLAVAVSAVLAGRTDLAQALRVGEER